MSDVISTARYYPSARRRVYTEGVAFLLGDRVPVFLPVHVDPHLLHTIPRSILNARSTNCPTAKVLDINVRILLNSNVAEIGYRDLSPGLVLGRVAGYKGTAKKKLRFDDIFRGEREACG